MIADDRIIILKGDITLIDADAIVNAANTSLLGGGGVDGAIHKAAGPGLLEECRSLNGCEVGHIKVTSGHNLKAKHVFHAVGPIWKGGGNDEHMLLASCYRRAMEKASELKLETIAFPAISTGVYRFPHEEAAGIAITEIRRFLNRQKHPETVYLVAFSDEQYSLYMKTLGR
jgi:O-acetyl-ADP-ribose deacetylase (regulator of RNase III)